MYPAREEVLKKAKENRLSDMVDVSALRFYGHILRRGREDTGKLLTEARIKFAHREGRTQEGCDLLFRYELLRREIGAQKELAQNREEWKKKIHKLYRLRTRNGAQAPL